MRFSTATLLTLLLTSTTTTSFTVPPQQTKTITSTKLSALPPPLIIGPMIRRMREERAKKNAPLATDDERAREAPGLKIGTGVWKWPPVWPYEERLFERASESAAREAAGANNPMASMLQAGGLPDMKTLAEERGKDDKGEGEEGIDFKKFWLEDKKEVKTVIDEETIEALQQHYSYYLRDGMSILEFGAAESSYLPPNITPARHVGISLSPSLMSLNPSLTETYTVDLNDVEEEIGINSDDVRQLGENSFDVIISTNTVEFLTSPREVFRSAFRLLKPGGMMFVSFLNKDAYKDQFGTAQTNLWEQFNDDQHIWVTGSFFRFSADEGWAGLKAFDISPEGAKSQDDGPLSFMSNGNKVMNMYVVQATKDLVEDVIDENDVEKSFTKKLWTVPRLEARDKMLVVPRLARNYDVLKEDLEKRDAMVNHMEHLPKVYECLIKMDQFAFPFNLQAQLAVDLIADPDFTATDEQIKALKMGLGLRKPNPEFWEPVGTLTAAIPPEEKVSLLSFIVPRFSTAPTASLEAFVTGLKPTISALRTKCPKMKDAEIQIVASELLACEILTGRSTRLEFASWLQEMNEEEVREILVARQSYRKGAMGEMRKMQEERMKEEEEEKETMRKYEEQLEAARKERTMVFNEKTGKMEEVEQK